MESCFSTLLKEDIELVAAGRTDTGVHAREMFAHFNYGDTLDTTHLLQRLNSFLPEDILSVGRHPSEPEDGTPVHPEVVGRFTQQTGQPEVARV